MRRKRDSHQVLALCVSIDEAFVAAYEGDGDPYECVSLRHHCEGQIVIWTLLNQWRISLGYIYWKEW